LSRVDRRAFLSLAALTAASGTVAIEAVASVAEADPSLLTAPFPPTGPGTGGTHATVPAVRLAYLSTSLDHSDSQPSRPASQLLAEAVELQDLRQACKFAEVGRRVAPLLYDLHAAAARGPGQRDALQAIVLACYSATSVLKDLGYTDLAWIIADRGAQAAQRLEDPLWIAAADFGRALVLLFCVGALQRAADIAARSADAVPTATREGLEVRGTLLLAQAFAAATTGSGVGDAAFDEAQQIAERTGQGNAFSFMFGPANVALWRVTTALEAGDPNTAIQVARTVNPDMIPARSRRAQYLADYGRALAADRRIPEAVDLFHEAERLHPDYLRNDPLAREAVQGMLLQARGPAGDRNLRGLASRMGVVPR
jgi:hypothetical protein